MNRFLTVKHTVDRYGRPLACIENMPGEGAEFSPNRLRQFGNTLHDIADECAQGTGFPFPQMIEYDLCASEKSNPFEIYRTEITGGYSTAQRLAALVKHLYNGAVHPVRLDNLLANADERHAKIAQRCIAWYAEHGEDCPEFMDLARHLVERDGAPAESDE